MIQDLLPGLTPQSVPAPDAAELHTLGNLSLEEFLSSITSRLLNFAFDLALAILVFYIGRFIIRRLHSMVAVLMLKRQVESSLTTFILSTINILLYFILLVTVIGILGVNTSSFLALFASAGVAIGMALSGTLQNFAGGVLILLLKPYRVGDYIEAQSYAGTVTEIQIFHTLIRTPDNKSIIIPNGPLSTGSVNNWSREDYRRLEWTVGISYGDDIDTARRAILDILESDDRIVRQYVEDDRMMRSEDNSDVSDASGSKASDIEDASNADPPKPRRGLSRLLHRSRTRVRQRMESIEAANAERISALMPKVDRQPTVYVASLSESSVDLSVRAWVRADYYWSVYYNVNEAIYKQLPLKGITFPFPQMDVHLAKN